MFLFFTFSLASQDLSNFEEVMEFVSNKDNDFIKRYHTTGYLEFLPLDEQIEVQKVLLPEARVYPQKDVITKLYSGISILHVWSMQYEEAKIYLDSAMTYDGKIDNKAVLAVLHYNAGLYYLTVSDPSRAHNHYYRAVRYLEERGIPTPVMIILYADLARAYIERRDTANLDAIIDKMRVLAPAMGDDDSYLLLYGTVARRYQIVHDMDRSKVSYLDSMSVYIDKSIQRFKSIDTPYPGQNFQISYDYLFKAQIFLSEPMRPAIDSTLFYLDLAISLSQDSDNIFKSTEDLILGTYYRHKKDFVSSELALKKSLLCIENMKDTGYHSYYAAIYDAFSNLYADQGFYKKAFDAESKHHDNNKKLMDRHVYEVMMELQTQYEVEKKESEISRLTEINSFEAKIRKMYIGIIVLILVVLLFIVWYFRSRRKSDAARLQIINLKKDEAELLANLEAERAVNAELEKYEALMDVHFKDLQLEGKTREVEAFVKEKKDLDAQIASYSERLNKYEDALSSVRNKLDKQSVESIFLEVKALISKTTNSDLYIQKVNNVGENFLVFLESKSGGKMSALYLKYCIFFAIGMETKQIAEYLCVELKTIHMVRYRLKQKLGLGKDADLDFFLQECI
ncbi:hypothetical protein AwDysgo_14260 [Bacteroidales bacterium]|nr:hypothetical protein AwDysgo_14260 [Bacteroidales bacterium]